MEIAQLVDSAEYPCEVYHEVTDTALYRSAGKKQIEQHHTEGAGITTIVDSIMGFASTHNMDSLRESYEFSREFAHHGSTPRVLPQPAPVPAVSSCFDPRIAEVLPEDMTDLADQVFGEIPFCHVINETILLTTQTIHVVNSYGVDVTKKGTFAVLDITLQDKSVKERTSYSCFYSRTLDFLWPLQKEAEQWHEASQKTDVSPGEVEVIFSSLAFSRILDAIFVPVFCGNFPEAEDMFQSGILSEIDVYDHGTLEGGMGTAPFDGEGVPQQMTPLIEKGHVASFLYDTTSGSVHKKMSTGNAYRESFEDVPQVYATNVYIPPVCKTEDLLADTREGILVSDILGASITHPPSGEFVSNISRGYRIRRGEITGMIPPKMIEGSISSLLKELIPGDDAKKVDRYVVPSSRTRVRVY